MSVRHSGAQRRWATALVAAVGALALIEVVGAGVTSDPSEKTLTDSCRPVTVVAMGGSRAGSDDVVRAVADSLGARHPATVAVVTVPPPETGRPYPVAAARALTSLTGTVGAAVARCPSGAFILLGQSEGAHVVGDLASRVGTGREPGIPVERVHAVGLVGDPARGPGARTVPEATHGRGILPSRPGGFGGLDGKTIEICAPRDPVCSRDPYQARPLPSALADPAHAAYGHLAVAPGVTVSRWVSDSLSKVIDVLAAVSSRAADPAGRRAAVPSSPSSAAVAPIPAGTRDVYRWPFDWSSIWNLPLADTAQYQPSDLKVGNVYPDVENISVDPGAPVRHVNGDRGLPVRVVPRLAADGSWNNCSTLLMDSPDRRTVLAGQPMTLVPGGDPEWDVGWSPVSLTGPGLEGCHGGSGLSGIGGTIRDGELRGPAPIRHVLKVGLPCDTSCSPAGGGRRWPANKADTGFEEGYGGNDPQVNMGSLLALPPDTDLSTITAPDVRKVAEALKTYGAYVVDSTGSAPAGSIDVASEAVEQFPGIDSAEMRRVFAMLAVVTNNGEQTPGGGSLDAVRRAPCAPAFPDGTGGAPPTCGRPTGGR